MQLRLRAFSRTFLHPDAEVRHAMRWYGQMGRRVWPFEIWSYLFRERRSSKGKTLAAFWGAPQDEEEYAMRKSVGSKEFAS